MSLVPQTQRERDLITAKSKEWKEIAKARRELKGKVIRAYQDLVMKGKPDEEIMPWLCERFDLTERRYNNIVSKRDQVANPKAQAISEAKMVMYLDTLEREITEQIDECNRQLDEVDALEVNGEDYYEMELVEYIGDKQSGKTIKSIPLNEARHLIMKRKTEAMKEYGTTVGRLRGTTNLIKVEGNAEFSTVTMQDLAARIKDMEKKNKIEDGVSE